MQALGSAQGYSRFRSYCIVSNAGRVSTQLGGAWQVFRGFVST